jgi:hypothetical protein
MSRTITIDVDPRHEALVRRALAFAQELERVARTAPDGTVLHACETAVIDHGRTFQAAALAEAVARRVEDAEKKGRRCDAARAAAPSRTAGPQTAD